MSESPQSPDTLRSDQTGSTASVNDQWFSPDDDQRPAEYDRISAQVDQLTDELAGAEPERVGTELADLHERADAIGDPEWRDQAHTRVDELPEQVSVAADQTEQASPVTAPEPTGPGQAG